VKREEDREAKDFSGLKSGASIGARLEVSVGSLFNRGGPAKPLTDPTLIVRCASVNRAGDRRRGPPVFKPIRYADDCVILVASPDHDIERSRLLAEQEKSELAQMLKTREYGNPESGSAQRTRLPCG
jgi:hypothetical protein